LQTVTVTQEALLVLRERRDWLTERVKAKQQVRWDTAWDERERDALTVVLNYFGTDSRR
jgi:hypothetical protein